MTFGLKTRGNTQAALNLSKQAEKEEKKAVGKAAKDSKKETDKKLRAVSDQIAYLEKVGEKSAEQMQAFAEKIKSSEKLNKARTALGLESTTAEEERAISDLTNMNTSVEQTLKDLREEQKRLQEERQKYQDAIDEGEAEEKEEKDKKMFDELDEIKKKADKEDKKEEKPK